MVKNGVINWERLSSTFDGMVAWCRDTQVAYLNAFSKHFNLNATYSTSQSQSELNAAAKTIQIKIEQKFQLKNQLNGFVKQLSLL